MDYLPFVEKRAAQFGEYRKTAVDLAKMLDQHFLSPAAISCLHPFLQKDVAVTRFDVLEDLSALALRCGLPIPDLESETLDLICGGETETSALRSRSLGSHIEKQLATVKKNASGRDSLAGFIEALRTFPKLTDFVDWNATSAWVNLMLLRCGGEPFRELTGRNPGTAREQNPPSRTLRAAIAETSVRSLARLHGRLAGFPGLEFSFSCLDAYNLQSRLEAERAADDLLAGDPDIVILSDSAFGLDGLAAILSKRTEDGRPVLVAASRILESLASEFGVLASLEFGYNLDILQTAFMLLGAL